MALRDYLMAGDVEEAMEGIDSLGHRDVINEFIYTACHTDNDMAPVLVDSVRTGTGYFTGDGEELLRRAVLVLGSLDKDEWVFPEEERYQGDPLSSYIRALRIREPERAGYLGREVVEKVGMDRLSKAWLRLSMEKMGEHGETFVTGSSCRRSLLFCRDDVTEYVLYWTSRFLSENVYSSKRDVSGLASYTDLAYDHELMRRACLHPGEELGNVVFLHHIKQNFNVLGNHALGVLIRELEGEMEEAEEREIEIGDGGGTKKGFREALDNGRRDEAMSHMSGLTHGDLDFLCQEILGYAARTGERDDPLPLIAAHSACEVSRLMGMDADIPLAQALDYLFGERNRAGETEV